MSHSTTSSPTGLGENFILSGAFYLLFYDSGTRSGMLSRNQKKYSYLMLKIKSKVQIFLALKVFVNG